jgi:hypothetical protein
MKGTWAMEEIMAKIEPHLLPKDGKVSHYNAVWEAIEEWFERHTGRRP